MEAFLYWDLTEQCPQAGTFESEMASCVRQSWTPMCRRKKMELLISISNLFNRSLTQDLGGVDVWKKNSVGTMNENDSRLLF